jgi:adenylate cyclase
MPVNLNTSSLVSVDQQLIAIVNIFTEIQNYLARYRPAYIPDSVYRAVDELAGELPNLQKQIRSLEDEWRSLRALAQINQVINSSLELDQLLQFVMDNIVHLTGAERGFLMLRSDNGEFQVEIARNWEQESIQSNEFALSRTILNRVVNDRHAVLTTNAQEDPRFEGQESIAALNLRSILCVPLLLKQNLIGLIYADNRIRSGLFTKRHLELLTAFSNQAAVAIENARLFASVRRTLAEVTELKNLMDNVLTSIPSGVLTTGNDERIVLSNRAAREILGRSEVELAGKKLVELLHSPQPMLQSHLCQVLESDQTVTGLEISPDLPERGLVELRLSLSPLKNSQHDTQGIAVVMEDLTETKKLEAQYRLLERMVSPAVIQQIDLKSLKPGGQRREITTLFADIRGFTRYGERVEPEELVAHLNRYLGAGAEAVLAEAGTVDKFLGDALMAWFNAPIPQPDHVLRAVRAALAMRRAIIILNRDVPPEQRFSFGVGIHVGDAILGLVGTDRRLDYTAIGDSVNTAKRIQENAGPDEILLSQAAYERIADKVAIRQREPIIAHGKSEPVAVVEVIDLV